MPAIVKRPLLVHNIYSIHACCTMNFALTSNFQSLEKDYSGCLKSYARIIFPKFKILCPGHRMLIEEWV